MQGITLTVGGKQLLFATDGTVLDATSQAALGAWQSQSTQKDNQIRYTVGGAPQAPLPAIYSFNDTNQLQIQLRTAEAKLTNPFVVIGGIEIDDSHNLNYILVDNTGTPTGLKITVYGNLQFARDTNDLTIALTGGGQARIRGLNGVASLQAEKNTIASFKADDLLTFQAETDNEIAGQEDLVVVPAKIQFAGGWDIQNGSLVFLSNIKGDPSQPAINIGFAGTLGGVTAGFVYFADAGKTQAAFNISGQHVFKAGKGQTGLSWESSIGFTGKTFSAQVSVDSVTNLASGQTLTIKGGLTLMQDTGGKTSMDLSLDAQYSFDANNMLVFKALVTDGNQYDLMLQGTFHYSNLNLTFQVEYTNQPGASDLHVAVGVQGNQNSIVKNLALVLDVSESQAKLQLTASFDVHLQFADGVRIKTPAVAAAAPQKVGVGG
ncbi:MAG TPA: hypothetical protein VKG25_10205 [Bryobacteraceae bacterium]|nr:hypothetical protein [Bryobacteraceae bacterium]